MIAINCFCVFKKRCTEKRKYNGRKQKDVLAITKNHHIVMGKEKNILDPL